MTNPNEAAHDTTTGAPAEGVTLNEGKTVPTPAALSVSVDDTKVYGYHAETNSLSDPYMGEYWDGKDGWERVKLVGDDEGGERDDELGVNVVYLDEASDNDEN